MKNWKSWLVGVFALFCLSTCGSDFTEPVYNQYSEPACNSGKLTIYEANGAWACKQ